MNVRPVVRSAARTALAALALSTGSVLAVPALHAQFGLSVSVGFARTAPPPLVEVDQPEAPGDGYIWTPGYWAWDDNVQDYYWVEGEWVMAPEPGLLWTPGYWNFDNGGYRWNAGYWGEHVGFYGGVNYGFGYFGSGYDGGYWNGNHFFYNTAVNRIDARRMRYTYQRQVPFRGGARVAYNGGPGGINVRPSRGEQDAFREQHFQPTRDQQRGWQQARDDRGGRNSNGWNGNRNGGDPNQGNLPGDRNNFPGDRHSFNGDRNGSNGNNGFRGGNERGQQPPVVTQPGTGQQGGWQGNRGNGGQQPPVVTQPTPGPNRWNGPGDGNNRLTPMPPMTRPFPPENRGNGTVPPASQPPVTNNGGNRGNGGGAQQPPQQQPRPQGGSSFNGGGERPSFNRGPAAAPANGAVRSFGRF